MTSLQYNESADEYGLVIIQFDRRHRVIRCRNNLQWIMQKRSSPDLNKGYCVGLSYHTKWESLTARYSMVVMALSDGFSINFLKPKSIEKHNEQN